MNHFSRKGLGCHCPAAGPDGARFSDSLSSLSSRGLSSVGSCGKAQVCGYEGVSCCVGTWVSRERARDWGAWKARATRSQLWFPLWDSEALPT